MTEPEVHADLFRLLMTGRKDAGVTEWFSNRLTGRVGIFPHLKCISLTSDCDKMGDCSRDVLLNHAADFRREYHSRSGADHSHTRRISRMVKSVGFICPYPYHI